MVSTSRTMLKIGIHSAFGPNSPMEFGTLDFKNLGSPTRQCLVFFHSADNITKAVRVLVATHSFSLLYFKHYIYINVIPMCDIFTIFEQGFPLNLIETRKYICSWNDTEYRLSQQ